MADHRRPATDPDHARHDPLRVAEAADRAGTLPADLAACPDCRALHADLVAIAAALPLAAVPRRPRDYRLTPADATRLRRTGWRRWFAAIGSSRDTITRPLALGLTTLGLAGLIVTGIPSLSLGAGSSSGAASAPADPGSVELMQTQASGPAMDGAASAAPAPVAPAMGDSDTSAGGEATTLPIAVIPAATDDASADRVATDTLRESGPGSSGISPVVLLSGALLVLGIGLFGLRVAARRRVAV